MGLSFIRIFVHLELTADIPDPGTLFRLTRSGWQNAFRHSLMCNGISCDSCAISDCPGYLAFSQSLTTDPSALRRFQKPSPPFIFDIPVLPDLPNKGTCCLICLTLVGNAVNHSSVYIDALRLLFERGEVPVKLIQFEAGGYGDQKYPFPSDGSMLVLSDQGVLLSRALSPVQLSIEFVTPLRLLKDGRPVRLLSPSLVLRSLMRRVSALLYYYGEIELEVDFKWLSRESTNVFVKDSTLRWEARGRYISGLLGNISLAGDLSDFHYFLAMGEYFNLGKGASYGFGNFILCE